MPDSPDVTTQDDEQDERIPYFIRRPPDDQDRQDPILAGRTKDNLGLHLAGLDNGGGAGAGAAPAIGNAYKEPAGSETAQALGEFATATGEPAQPPTPTHLSQVPAAQPPPQMPPEYAKTQEDLRNKSAVTPKYDPATGKVLPQYREGAGGRIGRAFLDAGRGFLRGGLSGAASGALEGAFGNKNAPGYYGEGAVNSQYGKDETARRQDVVADTAKIGSWEAQQKEAQQTWKDTEEVRKDTERQAYQQDTTEQRAKYQQDTTELKQQAEDLKEQLREITYDPKTKQFMHNDVVYTPKNVEEGAILETQHGIVNGPYRQMWDKERKNQPIHVHTGADKGFSARDLLKIKAYAKSNGIKLKSTSPDDISDAMTSQQVDEALGSKYVDPGDQVLRGDALRNFKADTEVQNIDAEMKKLDADRSLYTAGLGATNDKGEPDLVQRKSSQDAIRGIDQRIADLTGRRNAARDKYVQMQNQRQQPVAPGTQPPKANGAPVQTPGNPAAPKLVPIPQKSYTGPGGRTFNVGDKVGNHGVIKGFGKDPKTGEIHAMF